MERERHVLKWQPSWWHRNINFLPLQRLSDPTTSETLYELLLRIFPSYFFAPERSPFRLKRIMWKAIMRWRTVHWISKISMNMLHRGRFSTKFSHHQVLSDHNMRKKFSYLREYCDESRIPTFTEFFSRCQPCPRWDWLHGYLPISSCRLSLIVWSNTSSMRPACSLMHW